MLKVGESVSLAALDGGPGVEEAELAYEEGEKWGPVLCTECATP